MDRKELHEAINESLKQEYDLGKRIGYEQGRIEGYKAQVLPHPCDGPLYDGCTPEEHMAKITEEYGEVLKAFAVWRKSESRHRVQQTVSSKMAVNESLNHLFNECTDLRVATVSMMDRFGCHETARQRLMKQVNESNARRDDGRRFKKE